MSVLSADSCSNVCVNNCRLVILCMIKCPCNKKVSGKRLVIKRSYTVWDNSLNRQTDRQTDKTAALPTRFTAPYRMPQKQDYWPKVAIILLSVTVLIDFQRLLRVAFYSKFIAKLSLKTLSHLSGSQFWNSPFVNLAHFDWRNLKYEIRNTAEKASTVCLKPDK